MRDQIECVESLVIHVQAELVEILSRCRIALKEEAVKPTANKQSVQCLCPNCGSDKPYKKVDADSYWCGVCEFNWDV